LRRKDAPAILQLVRRIAERVLLFLGRLVAAVVIAVLTLACGIACVWLLARAPSVGVGLLVLAGVLFSPVVIHEFGHVVAAWLTRLEVRAVYLGGPPALVTVRLGGVPVGLGLRPRGRVQTAKGPPARQAIMTMAGPLANLVTAPLLVILPGPQWAFRSLALGAAFAGLSSLIPVRTRSGRRTDGAVLLRLYGLRRVHAELAEVSRSPDWMSRPEAVDRFLAMYRAGLTESLSGYAYLAHVLRKGGRFQELPAVHAIQLSLSDAPPADLPAKVHLLEWEVLCWPGLPPADIGLAAERMEWVLRHSPDPPPPGTQHTMAVVRLRQGRAAEVEALCASDLDADLEPAQRATVLATIAMARHALGRDGSDLLREAMALDPDADLVAEAAGTSPAGSP
jgi:peptidase M50-like protein